MCSTSPVRKVPIYVRFSSFRINDSNNKRLSLLMAHSCITCKIYLKKYGNFLKENVLRNSSKNLLDNRDK